MSTLFRYGIKVSNNRKVQAVISRNYYWFLHDYRNASNKLEKEYKDGILNEAMLHGEVKSYIEVNGRKLQGTHYLPFTVPILESFA